MTDKNKDEFVTVEMMKKKAGISAYSYFIKHFPNGARYKNIVTKMADEKISFHYAKEIKAIAEEA